MKIKVIVITVLLLAIASAGYSQRNGYESFTQDTLTDAETNTYTWSKILFDVGVLEYHVACDSITGNAAGTIYYEYTLSPAAVEWHTVSTDAIASTVTDAQHKVTDFVGYKARVRIVGTGTQTTGTKVGISFRRNR